jgi:hypothetical protein
MRHLKYLCLTVILLFLVVPNRSVSASEYIGNEDKIVFEDGSYILIRIIDESKDELKNGTREWHTISGSKLFSYYDSNSELAWDVDIHATFIYDGNTAMCITSSADYSIYKSNWTCQAFSYNHSGNTATVGYTFSNSIGGITISRNGSIACSSTGSLY